ncbi:MAG: cell division protein FtsZ [Alphaproteobacteria bacterium]|nr:MAG: cell division protein FtsZ [Alphaproteobacteria bacterium]
MTIELSTPELTELHPRITVMGVGGAGGNAVNNMIRSELKGINFVVANTDAQALVHALAETKIQLGARITQGLGAGSRPDVGHKAAEETLDEIEQHLDGCHMLFLTAGMGGGTGTGATPVIARAARERGILTVGVVTKPFHFEGRKRMAIADTGIAELQSCVDTLIIIPNQNLFRIATEKTTFQDAFATADEVLSSGVRGITDLMVMPGLINLDFADVKTVMSEMGKAMMGTGEADGERRAIEAAEAAISNPLLDEVSLKGAKGVIINITGGMDLTLFEVDEAANHIRSQVDEDANIIVGSAFDEALNGLMRVSVVATGIDGSAARGVDEAEQPTAAIVSIARPPREATPAGRDGMPEKEIPEANPDAAGQDAEDPAITGCGSEMPDTAPADDVLVLDEAADTAKQPAVAHEGEPFIAPEPVLPSQRDTTGCRPDAFAEAAFENAGRAQDGPDQATAAAPEDSPERGRSLFRRMTGLGQRATAGGSHNSGQTPDSRFGRLTQADRPVPHARNEEQLEIPAFLRRQAN